MIDLRYHTERGEKMTTGQLMTTLNLRVVLGFVAGETTVSEYQLLEDENFLAVARSADTMQDVVDWVNENY
jgi:hypothetical protein